MQVIISKGGYYYILYKNGKRKRISKDKYFKLLKKNKIIKQQGGSKESISKAPISIVLVTTYIEEHLESKLKEIVTQSYFWNHWMKPLLDIKQVKVKSLEPLKFSSIREPIFTNKPGLNFQNKLFEWWIELSNDFNNESATYCLMKDIDRELINEQANNSREHSTDYFYLQLPVVFINRLLQIIEFYNKILSSNNKLNNYLTTKQNVLKNNKSNRQMVNYYKKNSNESKLQNVYFLQELDKFREIFRTLDTFCKSNGLYTNLLNVELSFYDWYSQTVSQNKLDNYSVITVDIEFIKNEFQSDFNDSIDKKFVLLPTSMDPAEQYMISMYCIPVCIYLSKLIPVHNGKIFHPIQQIYHNLELHLDYLKNEYIKLSENNIKFKKLMKFRMLLISKISKDKKLSEIFFEFYHELVGKLILQFFNLEENQLLLDKTVFKEFSEQYIDFFAPNFIFVLHPFLFFNILSKCLDVSTTPKFKFFNNFHDNNLPQNYNYITKTELESFIRIYRETLLEEYSEIDEKYLDYKVFFPDYTNKNIKQIHKSHTNFGRILEYSILTIK